MKRFISFFGTILVSLMAFAQLNGDGFYRVQNVGTERYIYVYDNTGKINIQTTSADMGAIQLWKNHERTISDPASIIYIKKVGDKYDLMSQGTGVHDMINYYVTLYAKTNDKYQVYAEGKYLSDGEESEREKGGLDTNGRGDYRNWYIHPIDNEQEYFGITPSIESNGKYYAPFYADFGFSFVSEGMKAYYISKIVNGQAVLSEVKTSTVPASMPVLIECSYSEPSANKLNLILSNDVKANDNLLAGVYFNNPNRKKSADARTAYIPETMRVLGITSEGVLGYVKSNEEFLAANQSYLVVPAGTPDELKLVTEEELVDGIPAISNAKQKMNVIFTPWGVKVGDGISSIKELPNGNYIINNRIIRKY